VSAGRDHVAVAGGGLAGMSAAVALAAEGFRVTLLERRTALGGRAGSHLDASSGEWIDNCQHVLMPCCTNLLDFYDRIGVRDAIRFHREIPFIDTAGRTSFLKASPLPAPLHCAPSFLALSFLSTGDKLRIARGLAALLALDRDAPAARTVALDWFRARGQTDRAIRDFWELVLVSALNETLDRASLHYAAKVFVDAFLSHPRGWWLGVPAVPLAALYGEPVARFLAGRGGEVRLRSTVVRLDLRSGSVAAVEIEGGGTLAVDAVVVALPWRASGELLPAGALSGVPAWQTLEPSPITGIHLWFDRVVTQLDLAALPGCTIQWFFNKTPALGGGPDEGSYLQLVTSASRAWLDRTKGEILDAACGELAGVLPETRRARIRRALVLKEPLATFSPTPESEAARPGTRTGIDNLFLAGDWIRTGWPATMEGAVRAGYLAAEAVLEAAGRPRPVRVPDLAPAGLMRWLRRPKDADAHPPQRR